MSNENTIQAIGLLSTDFCHGDYQIMFDENAVHDKKDAPNSGASNICYEVLVKHKDKDEQPIPMILKEFCPSDTIFEAAISRDESGKLCYDFSPDKESECLAILSRRKTALEEAYAIQRQLAGTDQTMGIVVKPVDAWSPDELTYYTLHEANWAKSLDKDTPTDLREILRVMYMTADAVGRMDEQGFVHGDLKPSNILYTDRGYSTASIRLFDFDCSCNYLEGKYPDYLCGSEGYNAPELRESDSIFGIAGIYMPSLDVYSLGAVLFWLLLREHPTPEDETSSSYTTAPFYKKLIYKFEYEWRAHNVFRENQNKLAEILWRSIRRDCNPRISTSRYDCPTILADELAKLLSRLGMRLLSEDKVSRSSYTMLSAGIISQYPLYDYIKPASNRIDVVLAGISPMRDAFLEHLVSSCQMLDREIHVHIVAPYIKDYLNEIVQKEFGKVVSIQLNGKEYAGENYFPHDTSIVDGKLAVLDCWDKPVTIENLKAFSANYYLLVDTDTDANFRIAKELDKIRENPNEFFIGYTDSRGDGFDLREPSFDHAAVIGCNENFSQDERSFQSDIVERAFQVHKRYSNPAKNDKALRQEFLEETAYNKSSSIRAALSLSYEAYSVGIDLRQEDSVKVFETLLNERGERYNKLLWLEHRAWTGFMVMQGYQLPTHEQIMEYAFQHGNDQRDKKNKLHPCMCPSRAEGLQLSDKENPDWEDNSHDAEYDPLDQFSLFFHRFCGSKVTEETIRRFSKHLYLDDAETDEEVKFVDAVHTACESMLHGNNDAWDSLTVPEGLNEDLQHLFNALKTKIKFLHEYNRFHDFKASDEDILNAVPDIFKK